jgi:hypothetical protein
MNRAWRLHALWYLLLALAALFPLNLLPSIYPSRVYGFCIPYLALLGVGILFAFGLWLGRGVPREMVTIDLLLFVAWAYAFVRWPMDDDGARGFWVLIVGPMTVICFAMSVLAARRVD